MSSLCYLSRAGYQRIFPVWLLNASAGEPHHQMEQMTQSLNYILLYVFPSPQRTSKNSHIHIPQLNFFLMNPPLPWKMTESMRFLFYGRFQGRAVRTVKYPLLCVCVILLICLWKNRQIKVRSKIKITFSVQNLPTQIIFFQNSNMILSACFQLTWANIFKTIQQL